MLRREKLDHSPDKEECLGRFSEFRVKIIDPGVKKKIFSQGGSFNIPADIQGII